MRMSVNLQQKATDSLKQVLVENSCFCFRNNTIINAALIAFAELPKEDREKRLYDVCREHRW